jgi:hypothetical protein
VEAGKQLGRPAVDHALGNQSRIYCGPARLREIRGGRAPGRAAHLYIANVVDLQFSVTCALNKSTCRSKYVVEVTPPPTS